MNQILKFFWGAQGGEMPLNPHASLMHKIDPAPLPLNSCMKPGQLVLFSLYHSTVFTTGNLLLVLARNATTYIK